MMPWWFRWYRNGPSQVGCNVFPFVRLFPFCRVPFQHRRGGFRLVEKKVHWFCYWHSHRFSIHQFPASCLLHISATPATVYSKGLRTVLAKAPLDQILLETDSPVFLRNENRMSEPIDLGVTLRALAKLKNASEEYVAEVIKRNTENLFHLSL